MPLERKHEQKLWEAFRQPIDEAFNRKTTEREKAATSLNAHDQRVLDASRALEQASASGDAQRIRAAMQELESALAGRPAAVEPAPAPAVVAEKAAPSEPAEASEEPATETS